MNKLTKYSLISFMTMCGMIITAGIIGTMAHISLPIVGATMFTILILCI